MRKTASYRVKMIAINCTDPQAAELKMREAIKWGLTKVRRTLRCIKLEKTS